MSLVDDLRQSELARRWVGAPARPAILFVAAVVLEAAVAGGLVWYLGWDDFAHIFRRTHIPLFAVCFAGQLVAYAGYALAYRETVRAKGGVELDVPHAAAVVAAGFAPVYSGTASGGFGVDYETFRAAGMSRPAALARVLALSFLEYAVLAPVTALMGVLVALGIGGHASMSVTLPWLAVVPGALVAAFITMPGRRDRYLEAHGKGRVRRGFAHSVAGLAVLRAMVEDPRAYWLAFVGSALYWTGDLLSLWAALQVFDLSLPLPALIVAYATGYALSRRSLPAGGPGAVELLLPLALSWFGLAFSSCLVAVFAYRLFNFWLALVPGLAVLAFAPRIEKALPHAREARDAPKAHV